MGVGAAAGWQAGTKVIPGIEPGFIKQVRDVVTPGTSALFVLTSGAEEDKMIEELKDYDFEIVSTTLSREDEERIREAFGQEA